MYTQQQHSSCTAVAQQAKYRTGSSKRERREECDGVNAQKHTRRTVLKPLQKLQTNEGVQQIPPTDTVRTNEGPTVGGV